MDHITHEKCDIEDEWCIYLRECTVKTLNFGKRIVTVTDCRRVRMLHCLFVALHVPFIYYLFLFVVLVFIYFLLKKKFSLRLFLYSNFSSDFILNVLIKFVLNNKKSVFIWLEKHRLKSTHGCLHYYTCYVILSYYEFSEYFNCIILIIRNKKINDWSFWYIEFIAFKS